MQHPETLFNRLKTPIRIGGKTVANRLFLAPMAGLTHIALRQLIAEYGGHGLMFTEMCSARAIPHENPLLSPVFRWRKEELPWLVCQIFGGEPGEMVQAARRVEECGFFGVDLNFGCSAAAICKRGGGAALLKTPGRAVAIVRQVRQAVTIPLFIKYRTGWRDETAPAVDLARRFEDAGADALTFHPRTAPDRRLRPPRWERIGAVKQAVAIPVFGNGNVFDAGDCLRMLDLTGCDGAAIGRIAAARPWSFAEWTEGFQAGEEIFLECATRLADLMERHFDSSAALKRFKKAALYLAANFRYGHSIYKELCRAADMEDARRNIGRVFARPHERNATPNLNMFVG